MYRPSDEDLLGYALESLDPDEQDQLAMQVREDDRLRGRVEAIRDKLVVLGPRNDPQRAPTGLARRTCECIAAVPMAGSEVSVHRDTGRVDRLPLKSTARAAGNFSERIEAPAAASGVRWVNWIVVVAALVLFAAIVLPAVHYSRFHSRLAACQGNLQTVGMSLLQFADQHGGRHLEIPQDEKLGIAGFFAPQLLESGYVDNPSRFFCAGVSGATGPESQSGGLIPSLGQLQDAEGTPLLDLQRRAGGDYAFCIGYQVDGQYAPTPSLARPSYAVLADSPSAGLAGRTSPNHGGRGQNVFFEDGQVRFLESPAIDGASIFENDIGMVAPGIHIDDSVLAPSATRILQTASVPIE